MGGAVAPGWCFDGEGGGEGGLVGTIAVSCGHSEKEIVIFCAGSITFCYLPAANSSEASTRNKDAIHETLTLDTF